MCGFEERVVYIKDICVRGGGLVEIRERDSSGFEKSPVDSSFSQTVFGGHPRKRFQWI